MKQTNKGPGRVGRRPGRDQRRAIQGAILRHPTLTRNRDRALLTVCRRTLAELSSTRREYRDTMTPSIADAADHALSALEAATEIIEREVRP